jgi:hypothetical protein
MYSTSTRSVHMKYLDKTEVILAERKFKIYDVLFDLTTTGNWKHELSVIIDVAERSIDEFLEYEQNIKVRQNDIMRHILLENPMGEYHKDVYLTTYFSPTLYYQ